VKLQSAVELRAALERGDADYADVQRFHREEEQRLIAALRRARAGETDWEPLRYMMGRNELPDLLRFVWRRLPQDQLVKAVSDAWVMCEFPEQRLPRREWLPIFRAAGYHDELEPATPPDSITLWRGGVRRTRMASTADRERAEWFQHGPGFEGMPGGKRGKLWTVTVGRDRLLAHYHE
jgi:hypothetical protein